MAALAGGDGYDESPARLSSQLMVVAGAAAVMQVAIVSLVGAIPAMAGYVVAVAGLRSRQRSTVELGAMVIFVGIVVAGIAESEPLWLVGAAVGTTLVWDLGEQAITVGEQVGTRAQSDRGERRHALMSVGVGIGIGGVLLGVHSVSTGGFPVGGLVVLLVAALLLASAVRD